LARIPLCGPDDLETEPKAKAILSAVHDQFGTDFNVIKALANHPDALEAFMALQGEVYTSKRLTPGQTEIAYYTAAVANSCHY